MWQLVLASRHRLIHQEEQEEDAKRVPDGHGRSFGSWPWQKLSIESTNWRKFGFLSQNKFMAEFFFWESQTLKVAKNL